MVPIFLRLTSIKQSSAYSGIGNSSSTGNGLSTHSVLLALNKQVENVFILAGIASRVQSSCERLIVVYQRAASVK
jgi:hypothetical protein